MARWVWLTHLGSMSVRAGDLCRLPGSGNRENSPICDVNMREGRESHFFEVITGYIFMFMAIYFFREHQPFYGYLALIFLVTSGSLNVFLAMATGSFDKTRELLQASLEGVEMPLPTEKKDPEDKGRTMPEVSKDIQDAHEQPKLPEPKPKTPEQMKENPDQYVTDPNVTGE